MNGPTYTSREVDPDNLISHCVLCSGWWLVENEDKRMAWFPAPYLEKLDEDGNEDDGEDETDSPTGIGMLFAPRM